MAERPRIPTGRTEDGSRIYPRLDGDAWVRVGNKMVRDIPAVHRLLEIGCYDGGSRRGGRHLVAVVDTEWQLQARSHPEANSGPGVLRVLCRCRAGFHDLDVTKVTAAADLHRHRHHKGRMVDVRGVAPD